MYQTIDSLIVSAVERRQNPLYDRPTVSEAERIATLRNREPFRVIDGRLQALRKRRVIEYRTKARANGRAGWYLVRQKGASNG